MFRKPIFISLALVAAAMVAATLSVSAQNPIRWSIKPPAVKGPLKPGDKFSVKLTAEIDAGWHLYSLSQPAGGPIPTRITLAAGQPFKLAGKVASPAPLVAHDPNFDIDTEFYEGTATFTLPVKVETDAKPGKAKLQVSAFFQSCNDQFCLPPKTVNLDVPIEIAAGTTEEKPEQPDPSAAQSQPQSSPPATSDPPAEAKPTEAQPAETVAVIQPVGNSDQSMRSFLWLAMTLGALSLLTPCVFPMVPITVSYFTNHSAKSRVGAVRNALIYSGGIILTFTALGMALALIAGAAGINQFAANPWINLLITAIFIGFALSLFGAFEIGVPASVLTRLDKLSGNGRTAGTLLMGLTFTLTSFTCTAPFVGTLLVMAARGEWRWPLLGMLAFSTVFALPFFVLSLVPQLMTQMPRAGGWLNSVKVTMGFLEIAAAMKFLSNADLVWGWGIFTREVVLAVWVAVMLLMTIYLLGKFRLTNDSAVERIGAARLISALISLALCFYLLTGLFGRRLGEIESFLPPATEGSLATGTAAGELEWIVNDYEGALARAQKENKLVLIDFTGYTCTNCRWMEANMFPKTEVRQVMEQFVRVRLYTDGEGELYQKHQRLEEEKFGTVALPYYAIVDAKGNAIASFPGLTRNQDEFVAFLKKGQEASSERASAK
ncbi:MAG TPA: cytochrome c biogenesis protein CcdA [Blastocatellia bacterium]|jgi:thiol:disulfide interchange protein DsbD